MVMLPNEKGHFKGLFQKLVNLSLLSIPKTEKICSQNVPGPTIGKVYKGKDLKNPENFL